MLSNARAAISNGSATLSIASAMVSNEDQYLDNSNRILIPAGPSETKLCQNSSDFKKYSYSLLLAYGYLISPMKMRSF